MTIVFYILAALAVISALGVISARNPVYSALSLVVTLLTVAALYLTLQAEFLAIVQVLTYAGAILVLFIFIIMLLNLQAEDLLEAVPSNAGKFLLLLVSVVAFVTLSFILHLPQWNQAMIATGFGSVFTVGHEIFTQYIVPFEIAGVLLTVALVGAVLLAKKNLGEGK